VTGEGKEGK